MRLPRDCQECRQMGISQGKVRAIFPEVRGGGGGGGDFHTFDCLSTSSYLLSHIATFVSYRMLQLSNPVFHLKRHGAFGVLRYILLAVLCLWPADELLSLPNYVLVGVAITFELKLLL